MDIVFFIAAVVAVVSTLLVIFQANAVYALLYLILSLLAVALVFFSLGAPFAAALEVIIYAGAIMVLFIFVIMMLNLGAGAVRQERGWMKPGMWMGPAALAAVLLLDLVYLLFFAKGPSPSAGVAVEAKQVGISLFGPYLAGVELASVLLLAGLVGAYHLGRRSGDENREREGA